MKKLLTTVMLLLTVANAAHADAFRIVSDPVAQSCYLGPGGFAGNLAVINRYSIGETGAHFKIHVPSGSGIFSVSSPYAISGTFADLTINYGTCLQGGPIVIATFVATLVPGLAEIWPADGQTTILFTNCSNQTIQGLSEWWSFVGMGEEWASCSMPLATEPSTWGAVKALYR